MGREFRIATRREARAARRARIADGQLDDGPGAVPLASDAGLDLDRLEAVPAMPRGPEFDVILEGTGPWDWEAWQDEARAKAGPWACPVCWGRRLVRKVYCLRCDASGWDGRRTFPGLPVGRYPNREWVEEYGPVTATVYASDKTLKGGLAGKMGRRKARKERVG